MVSKSATVTARKPRAVAKAKSATDNAADIFNAAIAKGKEDDAATIGEHISLAKEGDAKPLDGEVIPPEAIEAATEVVNEKAEGDAIEHINADAAETAAFEPIEWQGYIVKAYDVIPPRNQSKPSKFPFDQMQPGNYFFEPARNDKEDTAKRMSTLASAAGKRYGKKFTVRSETRPVAVDGKEVMMKGCGVYCYDPAVHADA